MLHNPSLASCWNSFSLPFQQYNSTAACWELVKSWDDTIQQLVVNTPETAKPARHISPTPREYIGWKTTNEAMREILNRYKYSPPPLHEWCTST